MLMTSIRVMTKLPNSEQSYKGKVKTHQYINRQNQSTTENCENRNDPDLVQACPDYLILQDFVRYIGMYSIYSLRRG